MFELIYFLSKFANKSQPNKKGILKSNSDQILMLKMTQLKYLWANISINSLNLLDKTIKLE
ncbi:hypothetical protein BpHYR1_009788 [Brachionus plicatilis]|uniref:Uncharacterized protein n=1 Tax=Brachionus plicatilis TaxID=10195 RepID=A0A3M7P1G2_BRAPC|nr:hypothetical protein BpHYR1_009788 [Brachionus plicatilis]